MAGRPSTKTLRLNNMCNRIEDLIEKARHYEDLWHEAIDENKRLKAELAEAQENYHLVNEMVKGLIK